MKMVNCPNLSSACITTYHVNTFRMKTHVQLIVLGKFVDCMRTMIYIYNPKNVAICFGTQNAAAQALSPHCG